MKTRKAKTPRIQPESIVKVALEILDEEGLEHVTLRRLATKLGVQAPALY
jgi:TetR/AcrR family tetracycline transcriptional repressor